MTGPNKKPTPPVIRRGSGVTPAVQGPSSQPRPEVSGRYANIEGPPPSQAPRRASFTRRSHGPLRALVIAQDGDPRRSIVRVVQKHGGEALLAASLGEAMYLLDALDQGAAMVFVDPLTPGYDPRFVAFLRQNPHVGRSPIVIVSSLTTPVLEDLMRSSGADGFIVSTKGLLYMDTAVQSWLERHDAHLAN